MGQLYINTLDEQGNTLTTLKECCGGFIEEEKATGNSMYFPNNLEDYLSNKVISNGFPHKKETINGYEVHTWISKEGTVRAIDDSYPTDDPDDYKNKAMYLSDEDFEAIKNNNFRIPPRDPRGPWANKEVQDRKKAKWDEFRDFTRSFYEKK